VVLARAFVGLAPAEPSTAAVLPGALPAWPSTFGRVPHACMPGGRLVVAHKLDIASDEWICGRAIVIGASAAVFGRVGGVVVVVGGNATIAGQVDGDVTAIGGSVTVLQGARIGGTVTSYGGSIQMQPNVLVAGGVQHLASLDALAPLRQPFFFPGSGPPWPSLLFWALAGLIVARFWREPLLRVERLASTQFVPSVAVGIVATIATLGLALLLVVTCLGIPLALLLLVVMWVSWVVGTVAVGYWLGKLIFRAAMPVERQMYVLPAVVGVLTLAAIEALPYVGGVVGIIVGCVAVGSVVLAFTMDRRARRLPA
jgi:cytoskeletal protein CcmA (bactofilin family)